MEDAEEEELDKHCVPVGPKAQKAGLDPEEKQPENGENSMVGEGANNVVEEEHKEHDKDCKSGSESLKEKEKDSVEEHEKDSVEKQEKDSVEEQEKDSAEEQEKDSAQEQEKGSLEEHKIGCAEERKEDLQTIDVKEQPLDSAAPAVADYKDMKVTDLREALKARGLSVVGNKASLVERLLAGGEVEEGREGQEGREAASE